MRDTKVKEIARIASDKTCSCCAGPVRGKTRLCSMCDIEHSTGVGASAVDAQIFADNIAIRLAADRVLYLGV